MPERYYHSTILKRYWRGTYAKTEKYSSVFIIDADDTNEPVCAGFTLAVRWVPKT